MPEWKKTAVFAGVLSGMLSGAQAQTLPFLPGAQIGTRVAMGADYTRGGTGRPFERSYLRFRGTLGFDLDFGSVVVSPRVQSYGWNSALSPGRRANNGLNPYLDVSFGNWVLSFGDVQGTALPLPRGLATHSVIETRPIYAYYALRQDTDAENGAPLDGFGDNTRTSSAGKLALAYRTDDWFVRAIVDPGIIREHDPVAGVDVARGYQRLEGGGNIVLGSGTVLKAGAALWHQDSYQNTNGAIVDAVSGSKSAAWGQGATGAELGLVVQTGALGLGISGTAIRGPYSDPLRSTDPSDLRSAMHVSMSWRISDTWSLAGTYSATRWELSNNPALGVQSGHLLQIGLQARLTDRISAGLGYVWSDSSAWSGGATPAARLSYPVLGVAISF